MMNRRLGHNNKSSFVIRGGLNTEEEEDKSCIISIINRIVVIRLSSVSIRYQSGLLLAKILSSFVVE